MGEVVLLPGKGHDRPDAGEMLDDRESFAIRPGETVYVPTGVFHSTLNTGREPLRPLALYNPGGAERPLRELPDFRELPPGELPGLTRP